MISTVLFDLDGTLLQMDQDEFIKAYFTGLTRYFTQTEYDEKLVLEGVLKGTKAMFGNDGKTTNEALFWDTFSTITQISKEEIEPQFTDFYLHCFPQLKTSTTFNPTAQKCIQILKDKNYRLILATNPLFPAMATKQRIEWAGLNPEDFYLITTYENSSVCKPNPAYFKEILNHLCLCEEECFHVGNDAYEDGCIESLGIPCYLITDNLINKQNLSLDSLHWHGSFDEFIKLCKEFPSIK